MGSGSACMERTVTSRSCPGLALVVGPEHQPERRGDHPLATGGGGRPATRRLQQLRSGRVSAAESARQFGRVFDTVAADDDQDAQMAALGRVGPEIAARWPTLRPLDVILAGIEERAANVSEVWSWVGQYDLGRSAGRLFDDVHAAAVPVVREHTAAD